MVWKVYKTDIKPIAGKKTPPDKAISNPLLYLHIQCARGPYDSDIEPAKDDMLFSTSDTAATIEEFFTEIYGDLRNGNYAEKPKDGENSRSEGAEFDILPACKMDSIEVASFPRIGHKILSSQLPITQPNHMQRPQNDPPALIAFRKELLKLGRREGLLENYLTEDRQWMVRRVRPIHPIADIREPFKFPSEEGMASLAPFAPPMETQSIDAEALALLASLEDHAKATEEEEKLLGYQYLPKIDRTDDP
jgi:hypothetical protein